LFPILFRKEEKVRECPRILMKAGSLVPTEEEGGENKGEGKKIRFLSVTVKRNEY